jgi:hypothetical protein
MVLVGWCPPLPHQSGASDTFLVERHGIHCARLLNLMVAPLDTQETQTSQELDMGPCITALAFR